MPPFEPPSLAHELARFDSDLPVERARTPPSSWYLRDDWLALEERAVLRPSWQPIGPLEWVAEPGTYVADTVLGEPVVVVRGQDGELRAFFNVCRHHAAELVAGRGCAEHFVCPYHGWEYELSGRLRRAPRMGRVEGFRRDAFGLVPVPVAVWGPIVFVRVGGGPEAAGLRDWLGAVDGQVSADGLRFVERRSYELACNWKVFVDNYLDGGYHVDVLHTGLASQLDLGSYETTIEGRVVFQVCGSGAGEAAEEPGPSVDFSERVLGGAVYAWVYPNLMLNRYGPFLDTNLVVPLGPERCLTVFDYYVEAGSEADDAEFLARSLAASEQVQQEDIQICESVQRGLGSPAYDVGRYAPALEHGMYHFHRMLAGDVRLAVEGPGCGRS